MTSHENMDAALHGTSVKGRSTVFHVTIRGVWAWAPHIRSGQPIDVLIDGRRVWTFHAHPKRSIINERWPASLAKKMIGTARFDLAVTGESAFASKVFRLRRSNDKLHVEDELGRPQVVNKWGGLTTTFDSSPLDLGEQVLKLAASLVTTLREHGHQVVITSGTLLGWVRHRALLPQDDDADLAVIVTESQSPADIAITAYGMKRELESAGFTVLLHSAAHLQVALKADVVGSAYCDIFLGFFRGREYCQPFHLRSVVPAASLLPPIEVTLGEHTFPAPPVPEDWLVACYGDGWETPDPGFTFETPHSTRDRYENWFGTFNFGREFWDNFWLSPPQTTPATLALHESSVAQAAQAVGAHRVLDVGCGDGRWSSMIAGGRDLIAVDLSSLAVTKAEETIGAAGQARLLNLNNMREVLAFEAVARSVPSVVSLHDMLHTLTATTRHNTIVLMRSALRGLGACVATFPTSVSRHYRFDDPNTWHLPLRMLEAECKLAGLSVKPLGRVKHDGRSWTTAELFLTNAGER